MKSIQYLVDDCKVGTSSSRVLGCERWMFEPIITDVRSWFTPFMIVGGIIAIIVASLVFIFTHKPRVVFGLAGDIVKPSKL